MSLFDFTETQLEKVEICNLILNELNFNLFNFMIDTQDELGLLISECLHSKQIDFIGCTFSNCSSVVLLRKEIECLERINFKGTKHWYKSHEQFIKCFEENSLPKCLKVAIMSEKKPIIRKFHQKSWWSWF